MGTSGVLATQATLPTRPGIPVGSIKMLTEMSISVRFCFEK